MRRFGIWGAFPLTKENIFYLLRDHQAHHRAQCLVYLRMEGISGGSRVYVGWLEYFLVKKILVMVIFCARILGELLGLRDRSGVLGGFGGFFFDL